MNPYTVLGVDKAAKVGEIKRAYYRMAKDKHPDKGGNEEDFRPIAEAYACLSDPEKRAEYDDTGTMPSGVDLEAMIIREALSFLAKMIRDTLRSMVEHGLDRQPGDFVEAMKKFVRDRMAENKKEQGKCNSAAKLYADTLDRIFIKNPDDFDGADVVAGTIKTLQEENDFNQFALGNGLKVFAMCVTLLDMYGCNMPSQIGQFTVVFMDNVTITTSTM